MMTLLFLTAFLPSLPPSLYLPERYLTHLVDDKGQPHPLDPRGILKRLVDRARKMGYEPYMFSEIEFYLVDASTGEPVDQAGYCSMPPQDKSHDFRQELGKLCKQLDMKVKRIHHECGPGQNEIELDLTPCMKNADDTVLCMWLLEMLAAKRNQKIIFSPKPFAEEAGNGLHHHILFRDIKTGENMFANSATDIDTNNKETMLSDTCKQGIAGLLKYADEITAVFAGSKETFARLKPGFEAPIFKAWGFSNRTALVRVPNTGHDLRRFEYRGADASGSIHLFGAVLLAAVLRGIDEKLQAPEPKNFNVEELSKEDLARQDIYAVPVTLEACSSILKESSFLTEEIGPEMVEYLVQRNKDLIMETKRPRVELPVINKATFQDFQDFEKALFGYFRYTATSLLRRSNSQ